jgi:hypothetical protein
MISRSGLPPSPLSRRRQPRSAAVAMAKARRLWPWQRPAAFAMVSTPEAEDRPPMPWSRRRRPRSAAVTRRLHHGLVAGDRRPPVWPASLAVVSTPAAEIRCNARGLDASGPARPPSQPCLSEVLKRGSVAWWCGPTIRSSIGLLQLKGAFPNVHEKEIWLIGGQAGKASLTNENQLSHLARYEMSIHD